MLLDRSGDDTYAVDRDAEVGPGQFMAAEAQGRGQAGPGALVDAAGRDTFRLTVDGRTPEKVYAHDADSPFVQLIGQGQGSLGGTGLLLTGHGDTTYLSEGTVDGLGTVFVHSQAMSSDGAVGVLDDLGGDDRYLMRGTMRLAASGRDTQVLDPAGRGNPLNLVGQGASGSGGFGNASALAVLHDGAGDDTYEVTRRTAVEATSVDGAAHARGFGIGHLLAQGTYAATGAGWLLDDEGDDQYLVLFDDRVSATAAVDQDATALMAAPENGFANALVAAQGAGTGDGGGGHLVDLGGTDVYRAEWIATARAWPTSEDAREYRGVGRFQGSGPGGELVDIDAGGDDLFLTSPNFVPLCHGARGEAPEWVECAGHAAGSNTSGARPAGAGVVTSAVAKQETELLVDAVDDDHETIRVRGVLRDADGAAVVGAQVEARLDEAFDPAVVPSLEQPWRTLAAMSGTTDAEGRFDIILGRTAVGAGDRTQRVLVGFAGDWGLRPAVSTSER